MNGDDIKCKKFLKATKKPKKGRKPQWTEPLCNDLVDIVLNNETYKKKLIMEVSKTTKNGHIIRRNYQ